jgi:protein SCO1/2
MKWLLAATLALVTFASAQAAEAPALKAGVFDPPRAAPDFSLLGSNGRELKLSQYRGKVVVLGFGFTSCADVCPTTLGTLALARRELGAAAANLQVLYITVDPERDVPAQMKRYLAAFDPTFVGGTGSPEQLAAVRKDYGISAEKKVFGDSYSYMHSSFTYLIDRNGKIRALMPYGHNAADYEHDLAILLKE